MTFSKVLIIGLGQLGLAAAKYVKERGFDSYGYDINTDAVNIAHKSAGIKQITDFGSHDFDVYIICVSTHKPDDIFSPQTDGILSIADKISKEAKKEGALVSIESTIPKGTSKKVFELLNHKLHVVHAPHRWYVLEEKEHGVNQLRVIIEDEGNGHRGVDKGNGGKYLFLPPGYDKAKIPNGYIPMPSDTYRGYALLRSVLRSGSDADVARAITYSKRIKLYLLSQSSDPPETKFVDASGFLFDSTIRYDLSFFESLNQIVQAEPWLERDKAMIDQLIPSRLISAAQSIHSRSSVPNIWVSLNTI